jgi:hypothetical protein
MGVNDAFRSRYSSQTWLDVISHELGHALGIGFLWRSTWSNTPAANFFINGSFYTNTQRAFNLATSKSQWYPIGGYNKTPLVRSGGDGTASGHWENEFRPSSISGDGLSYPGLSNELMIGYVGGTVISRITIEVLVDFGFQEVNPGLSESGLILNNTPIFFIQENLVAHNCICGGEEEAYFL